MEQGIEIAAIGFLKVGASEEIVSKALGLSLSQVKKLKQRIQEK